MLPPQQIDTLRQIAAQARHRLPVHEQWGFAARSARGLGISALFAGESGTGKTMAAEVLANELQLDLYRIDLAPVVSKYIGETEKNLAPTVRCGRGRRARSCCSTKPTRLFGKRSEVKDSHDRYANIEVSYLLQRMEAYRGLAILTTNLKTALDRRVSAPAAFRRAFSVSRRAPSVNEIWRRVSRRQTPTGGARFAEARAAQYRRRQHPQHRAERGVPRRRCRRRRDHGAPVAGSAQ